VNSANRFVNSVNRFVNSANRFVNSANRFVNHPTCIMSAFVLFRSMSKANTMTDSVPRDAAARFMAVMKTCASGDNTIGNMLCWDRADLPVGPDLTQQYLPQTLVPSCDGVGYVGSNPTQFTGPQAAPCINQTGSSLLQYKDEARDGYIDPRFYKNKTRLIAPTADPTFLGSQVTVPRQRQARGPSMIADVTSNLGTLTDINVDSTYYMGLSSMPLQPSKGVVIGDRMMGWKTEKLVNY